MMQVDPPCIVCSICNQTISTWRINLCEMRKSVHGRSQISVIIRGSTVLLCVTRRITDLLYSQHLYILLFLILRYSVFNYLLSLFLILIHIEVDMSFFVIMM